MTLLMAMSADQFLARGVNDDMSWTGPVDKYGFKLLTLSEPSKVICVGAQTFDQLPTLHHRTVIKLTRGLGGYSLYRMKGAYPDSWLIGGPTVAMEALRMGLVNRAILNEITDVELTVGISAQPLLDELYAQSQEARLMLRSGNVKTYIYQHLEKRKEPGHGLIR